MDVDFIGTSVTAGNGMYKYSYGGASRKDKVESLALELLRLSVENYDLRFSAENHDASVNDDAVRSCIKTARFFYEELDRAFDEEWRSDNKSEHSRDAEYGKVNSEMASINDRKSFKKVGGLKDSSERLKEVFNKFNKHVSDVIRDEIRDEVEYRKKNHKYQYSQLARRRLRGENKEDK